MTQTLPALQPDTPPLRPDDADADTSMPEEGPRWFPGVDPTPLRPPGAVPGQPYHGPPPVFRAGDNAPYTGDVLSGPMPPPGGADRVTEAEPPPAPAETLLPAQWTANGAAPAAGGGGPRMPRIEATLDVPGYPGFRFRAWVNVPASAFGEIASTVEQHPGEGDDAYLERSRENLRRVEAVVRQMIIEHNGWCDHEGRPFPGAQEEGFLQAIPPHLFNAAVVAIRQEQNAPLARRRSPR